MIFESADYPDIDGLIDDAGNTDAATASWDNMPSSGDAYDDLNTLWNLLLADGFGGGRIHVGMNPAQYGEAMKREVKAGGSAVTYIELLKNAFVSEVYNAPGCTDGTVVMVDQNPGVATVLRGEEFKVRIFEMDKDHNIYGDVTGVFSIAVMNANGVGTETSC